MYKCKICENEYPLLLSLSKHLTNKHKYKGGLVQYYIDYENFNIPKCIHCNEKAKINIGLKFRKTCGSKNCKSMFCVNRKLSDKIKNKISLKLIESHKNGNHPGWSFINNDINKRSYPEKWFIKNVLEKHKLYFKYTIKEKMSFGKYFLDFALLDMKIDIEIDGSQHFTENAIKHDKNRDLFLLSNGWKVYRLAWLELKKDPNEMIKNFLNWLDENKKYRKYNINEVQSLFKKNYPKYGNRQKYNEIRNEMLFEKNKSKIESIKKSNIDFTKYGWVKKISVLIGLQQQKVNSWMKRYMKDFYEINCYKRNNSVS